MNLGVGAFCIALSAATTISAANQWVRLSSDNFVCYAFGGERDARETLLTFEQVRDFFMRVKSQQMTTTLPVTIIGFRSPKDYKPYQPSESAAAYYTGDDRRDYIVMGSLGSENIRVAIHEYMHLLVRHSGLKMPLWLNEGIADTYSTLKPTAGKVLVGSIPQDRAMTLGQTRWMPLEKLFAVTPGSPEYNETDRAGIFYAESWLLAHMLLLGNDYRDGFGNFLIALQHDENPEKAFDSVYHKKLWEVELNLRNYYDSKSLNGIVFKTSLEKISIEPARPATDLEIGITLAELTAQLKRYDEAVERLAELAKANPDNRELEQALAHVYSLKDDREQGVKHFRRAIELGASDWQTYWEYAQLLEPGKDSDAYGSALRKTLELKPDLAEARLALGARQYRDQNWEEAFATLRQVHNLPPERGAELYFMLAVCAMSLDRKDEAKQYAASARKYAKTERKQKQVDQLIATIDRVSNAPADRAAPPAAAAVFAVDHTPDPQPAQTPVARPAPRNVKGNYKRLDCVGDIMRMHIMDGRDTVILLVRHPDQVKIHGGALSALKCGPQNDAVSVDYTPGNDDKLRTAGEVLQIEIIE